MSKDAADGVQHPCRCVKGQTLRIKLHISKFGQVGLLLRNLNEVAIMGMYRMNYRVSPNIVTRLG